MQPWKQDSCEPAPTQPHHTTVNTARQIAHVLEISLAELFRGQADRRGSK
jgi:hypothetical protein